MPITHYLAKQMINHTFKGPGTLFPAPAFIRPSITHFALFTSPPDVDAAFNPGVEVNGTNYRRQKCELATVNGNIVYNAIETNFGQAQLDWGLITHVGVYDALHNGNLLCFDALIDVKAILAGNFVKFRAGTLAIRMR